eukprot:437477-Prymnesium_polylepis.1
MQCGGCNSLHLSNKLARRVGGRGCGGSRAQPREELAELCGKCRLCCTSFCHVFVHTIVPTAETAHVICAPLRVLGFAEAFDGHSSTRGLARLSRDWLRWQRTGGRTGGQMLLQRTACDASKDV